MLSPAISTDSNSRLSVAVSRSTVAVARSSDGELRRPLDAPPGVHEVPARVAHHRVGGEAVEGQQVLEHAAEPVLDDRRLARAWSCAARRARTRASRSTSQVSCESWSRTASAAWSSRRTRGRGCRRGRRRTSASAAPRRVGDAIDAAPSPTKPGAVPVMRVSAREQDVARTSAPSAPATPRAGRATARSSRVTASARSA